MTVLNEYRNSNGELHRVDGPAVETASGTKSWWIDGKRHREDGAAIEFANGDTEWYLNGVLHREDGPAVEWVEGTKYWFLNGEELTEEEFNEEEFNANTQVKELWLSELQKMSAAELQEMLGFNFKVVDK